MNKTVVIAILPMFLGALLYLGQVWGYTFILKRPGLALTFFSYALANVGLIWDAFSVGLPK